jgi:hypothetical protein
MKSRRQKEHVNKIRQAQGVIEEWGKAKRSRSWKEWVSVHTGYTANGSLVRLTMGILGPLMGKTEVSDERLVGKWIFPANDGLNLPDRRMEFPDC